MSRFFLLRFSCLCLLLGSRIPAIQKLSECRHASGVRRRLRPRGYYHKSLFSSATNRTGWTTDNRNFTFRVATVQDSGGAFRVHQAYVLAWFSLPKLLDREFGSASLPTCTRPPPVARLTCCRGFCSKRRAVSSRLRTIRWCLPRSIWLQLRHSVQCC